MQKFNALNYVGFNLEGKKLLEKSKLFVKDAKKRQKYVNDKPIENEYDGTALTIQFDRGQEFANSEFKLFVDELYDPEKIIDEDVKVHITNSKIYARSAHNFATLQISLYGSVEFVNNEQEKENLNKAQNILNKYDRKA